MSSSITSRTESLLCRGMVLFLFSIVEDLDLGSAMYFAFITGLTIGYGEITPHSPMGRVVAVLIGVVGMVFIGLVVGIATRSLTDLQQANLRAAVDQYN